MKLEVGMYVRLQNDVENIVIINKIANVFESSILTENDGSIYQGVYTKENVIKASFNIIDLIEVGDYVNEYKVVDIKIFSDGNKYVVIATEEHQSFWKDKVFEDNIKSIVTHQQFEQISYKLGE